METEPKTAPTLADDLLEGAEAIAVFIFGSKSARRKAYHLIETDQIPTFRLGGKVCARKSVIMTSIAEKERRASAN